MWQGPLFIHCLMGLSLYSIQSKLFSYGSGLRCRSCWPLIGFRIVQLNFLLLILLFLLPYSCFLPLSLVYSWIPIPISLVLLSPTHLLPCSCSSSPVSVIFRSLFPILHSSSSYAPTHALLLPLSYYSLTPGFLLVLSCCDSSVPLL